MGNASSSPASLDWVLWLMCTKKVDCYRVAKVTKLIIFVTASIFFKISSIRVFAQIYPKSSQREVWWLQKWHCGCAVGISTNPISQLFSNLDISLKEGMRRISAPPLHPFRILFLTPITHPHSHARKSPPARPRVHRDISPCDYMASWSAHVHRITRLGNPARKLSLTDLSLLIGFLLYNSW